MRQKSQKELNSVNIFPFNLTTGIRLSFYMILIIWSFFGGMTMGYTRLEGAGTALITPFIEDKGGLKREVNYDGVQRLVQHQIVGNMDFLVLLGTTGETPTLTGYEKRKIMEVGIEAARSAKREFPVVIGTGTNSTVSTITATQEAEEAGADYALVVTPYYNKPEQRGIYAHFKAVHDNSSLPIIVYNIAGRTGRNIETETLERLAELPRIISVKEASGDRKQQDDVIERISSQYSDFSVLSGDDGLTASLIQRGGHGVISVVGNLLPGEVSDLVHSGLQGNNNRMWEIHEYLDPIFNAAFFETNPQPIKYMMDRLGLPAGGLRLPLTEVSEDTMRRINKVLLDKEFVLE